MTFEIALYIIIAGWLINSRLLSWAGVFAMAYLIVNPFSTPMLIKAAAVSSTTPSLLTTITTSLGINLFLGLVATAYLISAAADAYRSNKTYKELIYANLFPKEGFSLKMIAAWLLSPAIAIGTLLGKGWRMIYTPATPVEHSYNKMPFPSSNGDNDDDDDDDDDDETKAPTPPVKPAKKVSDQLYQKNDFERDNTIRDMDSILPPGL